MSEMEKTTGTGGHHDGAPDPAELHVHVVPIKFMVLIWGALIFFTWVTVAVTYFDLGPLNLWIAMAIATFKALLVALYFMHLRWDRLFNGFIFMFALVFVMIFVGITLIDTEQYQHEVIYEQVEAVPAMQDESGH
jgi:cytochrome c oxidase subunit IV